MSVPDLDRTIFTLEQIRLLCRTPKDVLDLALPEAFGVAGRSDPDGSAGGLRITARGATVCKVAFHSDGGVWGYGHGLAAYANPRLEAAAANLMWTALAAAQAHELRTARDGSPEAEAARALQQFLDDPHAAPELAPEEIPEAEPSPA